MTISKADILASFFAVHNACPSEPTPEMIQHVATMQDKINKETPDDETPVEITISDAIAKTYELKLDSKIELKQVRVRERVLVRTIQKCDILLGTTPAKRVRRVSSKETMLTNRVEFLETQLAMRETAWQALKEASQAGSTLQG